MLSKINLQRTSCLDYASYVNSSPPDNLPVMMLNEVKPSRPMLKFYPRHRFGLETLTSLHHTIATGRVIALKLWQDSTYRTLEKLLEKMAELDTSD